jgi:hypothetical protein
MHTLAQCMATSRRKIIIACRLGKQNGCQGSGLLCTLITVSFREPLLERLSHQVPTLTDTSAWRWEKMRHIGAPRGCREV